MRFQYPLMLLLGALLLTPLATAQAVSGDPISAILINEVDADQSGTDAAEFVELYNPTGSAVDLSGGVLVFFNGSDDASYNAVDLDGVTLAAGDYFVYCGDAANVPNCDLEVGSGTTNLIQNGADAVALYVGSAAAFPEDTPATTSSLVDAVVYGTGDADDTDLLAALGETTQYDDPADESIQRSPDGSETFITAGPTSGAANVAAQPEDFVAYLLGANEVPAVETGAAGGVMATLTGTELVVEGRFDGLESDYKASIGSHLHGGATGENGDVEYALTPTLDDDDRGGTFEPGDNTFTVRETFADSLRNGLVYVNVHTVNRPAGEIRGQLLAAPDAPAVTLQQARHIGSGYAVSVSGTVSRAMGDFTYVQDATGGLAVRQTFGAFADDVADGTITGGTTLEVTGELSEYNGLLQINGDDLAEYAVTGSTDVPEPQTVTLADIAAGGEAYESTLLSVRGLTFADAGGTFEAGTNYDVTDGSGAVVPVRVIDADDTKVDGTAIPANEANVTGVLGQYDTDEPADGGYQLQPILESDVEAVDPEPVVTIAEAREAGVGETVRIRGTVSRAMGAYAYLQDDTGGLVVRQTSGAFNADIADETITMGTTLDVTGELSEYNGLLQINGDDLAEYAVTGSTDVPEPQVVTLDELAAGGEAYESELVTVRGLTFADAGGTFEAGTNYDVADGSGGAVQVRVVNANDTEVDGLAIPPANSNVTGVVGQYDTSEPADGGYQLQPILASDVEVATANEDELGRTGAMLAVENPARGAVAVRFAAGEAGAATITVFDAVGRQVAVLADGEVPAGEQSVELDASALAAGVYIVRLEVEAGVLTRVVTVVR